MRAHISLRRALNQVAALLLALAAVWGASAPAEAHRNGCHRWHSCPSDTGSYVCGDLGDYTYCGGSSGTPGTTETTTGDYQAPSAPKVKNPAAGAGGVVRVTVTAERGSRIEVRDDSERVAGKATATGSPQRVSFTANSGEHLYRVVAIDAAGNESDASGEFTVSVDADKPKAGGVSAPAADPVSGSVTVSFSAEAGAAYGITVAGRKDHLTGTVGDDGKVTGELWLPDGTYGVNVAVRDKAGNETRTHGTLKVSLDKLTPSVRRVSAANKASSRFALTGPRGSRGKLTVSGTVRPFTLDDSGRTTLTVPLPDGVYDRGAGIVLTDTFGRHGEARTAVFTVDTAPPSLTVTYDTERARYGEAVITVTGEPEARIRVTGAGTARSFTLQTGRHVLRAGLPAGTRPLLVTAQDAYGNTARRELRLVISDELTSGQLVRGLVGLLVFLGVLTVAAWLLWRHRRRLIVWNARRRERARLQAVERAARVAAQRQAREEQLRQNRLRQAQQDHARRLSEWQRRRDELAALHALAENLRGEETNVTDFRWGRHRAGERVLLVASVSLVEARTRQGVSFTEQTERGEMAVTDRRVLFDGAGKRREWAYDKWLSHEHQEGTGQTMMMVSNRQKSSGVAYSAAEAARVHLVIDLAVASSRGRRAEVVERTRRALSDHDRTRPAAPAGVG
ncbi:hypothetical protein [Actinacidiphila oryziradicis]|uniref:hypothetical protein n=1 Tax=Actinacidiphila oryziradicis TaxID=2571141 RepID=UPI0023F28EA7|nr:hypothetical protein [Actinacidiphila oryziradicis]MCW2874256.1 hypothetical protein [Actinacidiphila oryziradicis]